MFGESLAQDVRAAAGRIVRNVVSDAIRTATLAAVLGLLGT